MSAYLHLSFAVTIALTEPPAVPYTFIGATDADHEETLLRLVFPPPADQLPVTSRFCPPRGEQITTMLRFFSRSALLRAGPPASNLREPYIIHLHSRGAFAGPVGQRLELWKARIEREEAAANARRENRNTKLERRIAAIEIARRRRLWVQQHGWVHQHWYLFR